MKFNGGYNVMLEGEPSTGIATYEKPDALYLPLFSQSLDFSLLQVEDGDSVKKGQILAKDPVNFSVPLLAPMDGTVNLELAERHIILENLTSAKDASIEEIEDDDQRQTLLRLGVWSSMARIDNNRIPDPERAPESIIIPVFRFEPFLPNTETLLKDTIDKFGAGLNKLHKMLDDARIYLVVSETDSNIKTQLQQISADNSDWLKFFEVPDTYPFDSPPLVAQMLELNPEKSWTTDVQAVCAAENAIEDNNPYVKRVISVGGPLVQDPSHHQLPLGYPLSNLIAQQSGTPTRVVNGGVLTGAEIDNVQLGVDTHCQALTVLEELTEREVLAFVNPGFTKQSYSRTFASALKPLFKEKSTTALGGEARPCVFCGFCERVCPAGIIPHLVYRYLDNDRPEDAYRVEFEKCIDCGLCSYVCVSKINHLEMFRAERQRAVTEMIEG